MVVELQLQPQDVELIKQGEKENPTWINGNEKAIKYYKCRKYKTCLELGDKKDAVNWSCVNCSLAKYALVKDLVICRARKTLNKFELETIIKFEKSHHIKKVSKTDNRA
jgi:hypothetical protein